MTIVVSCTIEAVSVVKRTERVCVVPPLMMVVVPSRNEGFGGGDVGPEGGVVKPGRKGGRAGMIDAKLSGTVLCVEQDVVAINIIVTRLETFFVFIAANLVALVAGECTVEQLELVK
jgi:hypothetical protein